MRYIFSIVLLVVITNANAQDVLYTIKKDSSGFLLTAKGASLLASLPLKCLDTEYPNKTSHTSASDSDHVMTPRQMHPAFFGCFDWHSCVHGHWMLIKLLKQFPELKEAPAIRSAINKTITAENIAVEVKYFEAPLAKTWERTYGWAWLLKLHQELNGWDDADGRKWLQALQPLTDLIVNRWMEFLPKQTYPNRTGVHPNTAFGLVFALDYARDLQNTAFENAIVAQAKRLFGNDKNAPASWEPDGTDFLSPALEEADLMRRVLSPAAFVKWFAAFMSVKDVQHLSQLPVVSDRTDYQIVHLDGLSLSRSWCMKSIATALPAAGFTAKTFRKSSIQHMAAALPHVVSGNYGGEHWLASFAVYALTE